MSMINELVDRLRAESKSMGAYGTDYMATLLMRSADTIVMLSEKAREPKRGEWVNARDGVSDHVKCTNCFRTYYLGIVENYNFCPNCGARMKGVSTDIDCFDTCKHAFSEVCDECYKGNKYDATKGADDE